MSEKNFKEYQLKKKHFDWGKFRRKNIINLKLIDDEYVAEDRNGE